MKKIKILFLAPIRKGGPHLSLKNLSEYINLNYSEFEIDFKASISGYFSGFFSKKYDLIHTVLPIPFNIWRTPFILNIRGNYKVERHIKKNPLGYLYPISIFFSNKVIVPSLFLKEKLNLNTKIVIINNFVKENLLSKTKIDINNKKINLCILTKFHFKEKAEGVLHLINILNNLKTKKNIILNIIGGGDYLDEIKVRSKNILSNDSVELNFLGFKNDVINLLLKQDIFCYYSDLDNFPNALLEAMALGLPVLTNDVGAVKEFISNNFVFGNDEDYIKSLDALIVDINLRKKIGYDNHNNVLNNFSIVSIANKYVKEYKKLIK